MFCPDHPATQSAPGHIFCEICLERKRIESNNWTKQAKLTGMCLHHRKKKAEIGVLCKDCWFDKQATRLKNAETRVTGKQLAALFEAQRGLCPYTKKLLVLGGNASIDHIISKRSGGTDDLSNLQWVDYTINRMKTFMSHSEFLETCLYIASKFDGNKK